MNVEELSQYLDLKKELKIYDDRIAMCKDADELAELKHKRQVCSDRIKHIEDFISSIPNTRTRIVFARRYEYDETWQRIAFRIEVFDRETPRRIHNQYLAKIQHDKNSSQSLI